MFPAAGRASIASRTTVSRLRRNALNSVPQAPASVRVDGSAHFSSSSIPFPPRAFAHRPPHCRSAIHPRPNGYVLGNRSVEPVWTGAAPGWKGRLRPEQPAQIDEFDRQDQRVLRGTARFHSPPRGFPRSRFRSAIPARPNAYRSGRGCRKYGSETQRTAFVIPAVISTGSSTAYRSDKSATYDRRATTSRCGVEKIK